MLQPGSHQHRLPDTNHVVRALEAARLLCPVASLLVNFGQQQAPPAGTACRERVRAEPGQAGEGMLLESVKRKRSRKMNKHKYRKRLKKMRMGKR